MKAAIMHPVQAAELEAIVRALASYQAVQCLCGAFVVKGESHRDGCLWLRARKALGMDVP